MPRPRTYEIEPEWEAALRADPCAYCGAPARDLDHIVAVTKSGDDGWENLTASCGRCNKGKSTDSLLVFLWKQTMQDPPVRTPQAGVHWRKDIKKWAAYVDVVRRRQLGHFNTQDEAIDAVAGWWQANPGAMSPRARRREQRLQEIGGLWAQGKTMREVAEITGMTHRAVMAFIERERKGGSQYFPRVGRGGPGKKRQPGN